MANQGLRSFGAEMYRKARGVELETERVLKSTVLTVVKEVSMDTPYKTGQAQSNWFTSIGTAFSYYSWNEASNAGYHDSISFAQNVLQMLNGATEIHITNNLPYIAQLNRGTSNQAPALFVQAAVLRASYNIRRISITL